jgi:saccharopine dehydrogenase-like NADP-dependent oxidoreductase
MKRFIVLGGYGIIGKAVVDDLFNFAKESNIIISGRDAKKSKQLAKSYKSPRVRAKVINILNKNELIHAIKQSKSDVVINCLQYYFNIPVMQACLKAETHYLDLGGLFHETRKQLKLKKQFQKINKTALLGGGSTPGITNVLAAYAASKIPIMHSIEITFADYDETKYQQKFVLPYSFKTLVDELTQKPAVFKNGKLRFTKPFEGAKEYTFPSPFNKQRAFYTLHSELATFPHSFKANGLKNCEFRATFQEEFTNKLNMLIELGFTSNNMIPVEGCSLPIKEITAGLMNRLLPPLNIKIKDQEIIRLIINKNNLFDVITYSNDRFSAGVRNTAISCSIIAQMLVNEEIKEKGVFPLEGIINPILFFRELKRRNIVMMEN